MTQAEQQAPLVVLRSETEPGRVVVSLIGELDLHTIELLDRALAGTRDAAPPSIIDLSRLRFMDLAGFRTLLACGGGETAGAVRLAGATGIVRRLIALANAIDTAAGAGARGRSPAVRTTTLTAVHTDAPGPRRPEDDQLRRRPAAPPALMSRTEAREAAGFREPARASVTDPIQRALPSMRSISES